MDSKNKERERVAKETTELLCGNNGNLCGLRDCSQCGFSWANALKLASWHLKEVEKARAEVHKAWREDAEHIIQISVENIEKAERKAEDRGMKKAAEEIFLTVGGWIHPDDYEKYREYEKDTITTANKTLEAEEKL